MAVAHPHSKLLTAAARSALRPLGLVQKGRSRTWLDDQGWWLGVVEFQPSSYSRGSYLNVGVNWLWNPKDYLSFNYGHRVHFDDGSQYVEYESDEQFAPLAEKLATAAAEKVLHYRQLFPTVAASAAVLSLGERAWIHAAIALGLNRDSQEARVMFARHIEQRPGGDSDRARSLNGLLDDSESFGNQIREDVIEGRRLLGLDTSVDLPF